MYNAIVACLALNIYFEARNQSFEGQVAVAQVVFNRVADHRYPDNVCDVIYQAERNKQGKSDSQPLSIQLVLRWQV